MLAPLSQRVNDLDWQAQVHLLADQTMTIEDILLCLLSPIVFDHMGRLPQPAGINHPAFPLILKLIDKGRAW